MSIKGASGSTMAVLPQLNHPKESSFSDFNPFEFDGFSDHHL